MEMDSESDDEEFEGVASETIQSVNVKESNRKGTEDQDYDDDDDFKGSIKISGRKRKAAVALESDDDDDSGSDEDGSSSDDGEDDDDGTEDGDDEDNDDNDDDDDDIEGEDTLDEDFNEDDDMPNNSDQCPICLMSLGGQKLGTPNDCQHVFCLACILEWSKNANTCPVDRKVFHEIMVHSTKKAPVLQRIQVEDRRVPDVGWEQQPTFCEVCNQSDREDRMLLCDGCDKGHHLECLRPRLYTVPAGSWYCTPCLDIRRNEQMGDNEDSVPEMLPGTVRQSRGTTRDATRREISAPGETDGSQRARTAATSRPRPSSTRGRGRGRGRRTASRSSGRGRSRTRATGRSRTGSSTRGGRGGKKKTRKRRTTSTTGKPKRKKRKRTSTKKKRTPTKSKAKKRKVDNEDAYRIPFDAQAIRGRTPRERISNSLRASGSSSDAGRGLGMSTALSVLSDNYALNGFVDDSTNEPEQSDSSSIKSVKSDVLGSIFEEIEMLHDYNATVSRDGRVLPSESHDKHSPNKGSHIEPNESSSNPNSLSVSCEGNDETSVPRDLKHDEKHGLKRPENKSRDSEGPIPRDHHFESHAGMHKSRDAGVTKFSRDRIMSKKLDADEKAETSLNSNNDPEQRTLVKEEFKARKKSGDFSTSLQTEVVLESNKLEDKSKTPSAGHTGYVGNTGEHTGYTGDDTIKNRPFKDTSDKNYIRRTNLYKITTTPTKTGKFTKDVSLPHGTTTSSSSRSCSKKPLKQPYSPGTVTPKKFKIPKKTSTLPETSSSKDNTSSVTLSNISRSLDPLHSKPFSSTYDVNAQVAIRSSPTSNDSSRFKRVSPIYWTNRDCVSRKVPAFEETSSAIAKTKSSIVVPKASLPETSPNLSKDNELNTSSDKNVILTSDSRNDFSASSFNFEANKSMQRLDEKKAHVVSVPRDYSHQSAFSPFNKNKSKVLKSSFGSSFVKQEDLKVNPTTEVTTKSSCLNQSPSSYSKPSLQQLPAAVRSSSPSSSKTLGPRPSSTGLTGFTSNGSSGKTEKESPDPEARVIEYSEEKGELKIKVVPGKDDIHPALRRLSEETRPALRSLPEETHPALRSLPEEARPVLRSLPEETHLALRIFPEDTHPALRSLPEETHLALRSLPGDNHPALQNIPEETYPTFGSLPEESHPSLRTLPLPSLSVESSPPSLNTVQLSLTSLKPLKHVAKKSLRPKLKMLSTFETAQPASGTLVSGIQPSREFPKRTDQNIAIIQMLRHKTSTLRAEVEQGHSLLRGELESNARETPDPSSDSSSRSGSPSLTKGQLFLEGSHSQREISFNRPKLSSLLGLPRSSNLPVAVVRPSPSYDKSFSPSVSFGESEASGYIVAQIMDSEREKNRRKGIARLQRIERVKNVVKGCLQPYYSHKEITKQDFKEIFIRAVDKVKDSSREVDRHRIASLVKKYVKMFKGLRLIGTNQDSDL